MPLPPEQIGAVPQGQAQNPKAPLSPDQLKILRSDPEIQQAIEMFVGRPVPMESVPDDLLKEIAGMVHKLGVQGAVQMAQKMLPPEVQQQLKQGAMGGQGPQAQAQQQMPQQGAPVAR